MPKGGARIGSGRAPEPDALRRERPKDKDGWTSLPAEGYRGRVPRWPLDQEDCSDREVRREREVWRRIWRTPHAEAWSRLGWVDDVAFYVRCLVKAEAGSMSAVTEMRQWSDRLGLNPAAMLRNRWKVAQDEVAPRRESTPSRVSSRDRLKVADGAGG